MGYNLKIQRLVLQTQSEASIQDKLKLLLEAIQIADFNADIDWGFDLRIELITTEVLVASTNLSVPAIVWILDIVDTNPDYFEPIEYLHEYKWLFACSFRTTDVSPEQFFAIAEDFIRRLEQAGYSKRAYFQILAMWYQHIQNFEKGKEIIALLKQEPIDELSDNMAFELTLESYNLIKLGFIEEALIFGNSLFSTKFEYLDTAFDSYCVFAYEFFLLKDPRAYEYFRLALSKEKQYESSDCTSNIRSRILFMFLQDQYGMSECWSLFEKICWWEQGTEDYYSFYFIKFSLPMLKKQTGYRKFSFPNRFPLYAEDGRYNMQELFIHFKQRAMSYAKAFDNRNGNNFYKTEIEYFLSLK